MKAIMPYLALILTKSKPLATDSRCFEVTAGQGSNNRVVSEYKFLFIGHF